MKRGVIVAVIAIVFIFGLLFFINRTPSNEGTDQQNIQGNVIKMTSSGFSPQNIKIKQGESVTFINEDTKPKWPASDIHPTHTLYPNSDIKKCNTPEENTIFDACRPIAQGGTYTFKFNEKGSWDFHDHLFASSRGEIEVE